MAMRIGWIWVLSLLLTSAALAQPATAPATTQSTTQPAGPSITTTQSPASAHDADAIPVYWVIPFVLLLAAIALMPFIHKHWWEKNYPKVAIGLALLVAGYYFFVRASPMPWVKEMKEYVSFIILLGSLYLISGGISIRVNRKATPVANSVLLLLGAVIANLFGTTGAAMLLIRPYLRMNRGHIKPYHIIFFIFVVANAGGSLTPIGDPPLFLGYLKGVPFFWVIDHMKYLWLLVVGLLVAIFFVIDMHDHGQQEREHDHEAGPQVHVLGIHNFLFIGAVVWAVFRPSFFDVAGEIFDEGFSVVGVLSTVVSREVMMLAAALVSRRMTGKTVYEANEFTFGPIKEVAILFVGIFSTMVPALQWLEHTPEKRHIQTPGQYYFASGILSSMLDNAPTYLTFLQARMSQLEKPKVDEAEAYLRGLKDAQFITMDAKALSSDEVRGAVTTMIRYHEQDIARGTFTREQVQVAFLLGLANWNIFIVAISAGSVFWGACTYIGNGPNFMVKSIADAAGVRTPHFLEYIVKYALPILIPIYVVVWAVFFWGR